MISGDILTSAEIDSLLAALGDCDLSSQTYNQEKYEDPVCVLEMTQKNKQTILKSLKFEINYLQNRLKEIESVYFAISKK